jgi:hypothetical protein
LNLDVGLDLAAVHHEEDVLAPLKDRHRHRTAVAERAAARLRRTLEHRLLDRQHGQHLCEAFEHAIHDASFLGQEIGTSRIVL